MKRQLRNRIDIDRLAEEAALSYRAVEIRKAMMSFPCPSREETEQFYEGQWDKYDPASALEFRRHLLGCLACAQRLATLQGIGLPEELMEEHIEPAVIWCYVRNQIPKGQVGDRLRDEIVHHLRSCEDCHGLEETARAQEMMQWGEIEKHPEKIVRVLQLFQGLALLAAQHQELARKAAARRMFHRTSRDKGPQLGGEDNVITALVFDPRGRLVIKDDGEPCTTQFEVLASKISQQEGLLIRLSTLDQAYHEREGSAFNVHMSLQHEARCLCFPPAVIHRDGSVIIKDNLRVNLEINNIPLETLKLTVQLMNERRYP